MTSLFPMLHRLRRTPRVLRLWPRRPVVRQYDQTDCGPAALLSVLRYWDGDASLADVRELSHTGGQGTTLLSLCHAANQLGFTAEGARGSYDELRSVPMPCIAHLVLEDGLHHFVVVYEAGKSQVVLGDPAGGIRRLPETEFRRLWASQTALLLTPGGALLHRETQHWFRWMCGLLDEQQVWFSQVLFLGVLVTATNLGAAVLVQSIIDALQRNRASAALVASGAMAIVVVARAALAFARQHFLVKLGRRVGDVISTRFLDRIFALPWTFYETRRIGDLTARITDAIRIQLAASRLLGGALVDLLLVVASLVAVWIIGGALGAIVLGAIALLAIVLARSTRRLRQDHTEALSAYAAAEAGCIDALRGARTIRGFCIEEPVARANQMAFDRYHERTAALGRTQASVSFQAELAGAALVAGVLGGGAYLVGTQELSLGALMATYSLAVGALAACGRLAEAHIALQGAAASASRLMDLLAIPPEREKGGGGRAFPRGATLRLHDVSFGWAVGPALLHDVSLELRAGEIVGLAGASGAGKSTLVKLLQRHYAPSVGSVVVGDVCAESIELSEYRRAVAALTEDTPIFAATLAANVALGRPHVTPSSCEALVRELGLASVLARFPAGWATLVGERGRQISAGERQIVGLLRALAGEPSVLIVDEGLNGMDGELMRLALRALRACARDRAVLLITHDERVLATADRHLIVRDGRVLPVADVPDSHERACAQRPTDRRLQLHV